MAPRVIVLGWDSATFDVAAPLMDAGKLPVLSDLMQRGFYSRLQSVWPPMTDCAWTSAFTGRNAGGHGLFGSWYRAPGAYECRYFSSRDRRAPALWELAGDVRFLVWNVPMTYPPSSLNGAMVAGYGAPPGAEFCDPPSLQETLGRRWSLPDLLDRAPHASLDQFFVELLKGIEAQSEALVYAAKKTGADCVIAVWPHIDRAQHFFWRFRNTDHRLADAVDVVYEATDRATGSVIEQFPDADVIVVSDHGAGPLHGDVNVGAWLAARGHATYGRGGGSPLLRVAWAFPPRLRKLARRVAPGAARRTFAATLASQLGPFDWSRTAAFVGFHGDLWLNLEGREPQGCVAPADAEELLQDISYGLAGLVDPERGRVFADVLRGTDVYSGPASDLAPDLVLDSWSSGYRVAPGRERSADFVRTPAPLAGVAEAWSADHRPFGIFAAAGPRTASGASDGLSLTDVCPTVLALLERPVPAGLDGHAATEALTEEFLAAHPVTEGAPAGERAAGGDYSEEEAAAVAEHLRDLGYLE